MSLPGWWCTTFDSTTASAEFETFLTECAQWRTLSTQLPIVYVELWISIGCETLVMRNCDATITEVPSHHPTINAWKRGWTPMWWYPLIHDRQQESYEPAIEKV